MNGSMEIVLVYAAGGAREDARRRNGARIEIEEFGTMAQERAVNDGSLSAAGCTPISGGWQTGQTRSFTLS